MINKTYHGKVFQLKMIYLIRFFFIIFIFFNNIIFADDNKIIFKVNENIISTIDLKNRIKYLEVLNSNNFNPEMEIELINDYYNSVIFYEYVKNNDYLNNILQKEITNLYEEILLNNNNLNNHLNTETIKSNIKYDYARKIVLENILDSIDELINNITKKQFTKINKKVRTGILIINWLSSIS